MQLGTIRLELNVVTVLTLIMLVLSVIEVIRTFGVVTRPLSFAVLALAVLQLLWILGVFGFPGWFNQLNIWLAIIDAAIIPICVALSSVAIGKRTVPIASAIGLLAFVQLLLVSGIVRVSGVA